MWSNNGNANGVTKNERFMVDDKSLLQQSTEMAEHANGAAQYLDALLGGRHVTKEQTRDMVDFLLQKQRGISKAVLL